MAAKRAWSTEKGLETALEEAKKNRAAAEAAAEKAKALSSTGAMKEEMDSAVKEVETDVTDLEDCKKKLAEAKEHLKTMMKDKEDHEGARAVEAEQAQARALTAQASADDLAKEASEKHAAAADLSAQLPATEA